jgi:hypothetical protein
MHSIWAQPEETVFHFNQYCSHVYFLVDGTVVYVKCSRLLPALASTARRTSMSQSMDTYVSLRNSTMSQKGNGKQGLLAGYRLQHFTAVSEAALWTRWNHMGECTSQSHSSLLALQVADFQTVCTSYCFVLKLLREHARYFVNMLNKAAGQHGRSDLCDTMRLMGSRKLT